MNTSNFEFQAKGLYRIIELKVLMDEAATFQRIYKYQTPVEKAVSIVITDEINPYLAALEARVKALEDAQNNS